MAQVFPKPKVKLELPDCKVKPNLLTQTAIKEESKVDIVPHALDVKQEAGSSRRVESNSDQSTSEEETEESKVGDILKLLVKEEIESDIEGNYELSPSDIEKEFEVFNKEDEKVNSGKTKLENNTTAYKCKICDTMFTKFPEYKAHKKNHFIEKRRCHICNIVCQSIGKLEDHVNKHLGLRPHGCDECGKKFLSKHHVKLHQRCHSTEKIFQCKKCPKAFRSRGSLRSHQLIHYEKLKEFVCKVCNENCMDIVNFRKHMETHGNKSEIRCGLCNKVFSSDRGLECHLSNHKELKFPCEFCGKIYPSMYRIKRHVKRAHIPNQCAECGEWFFDRALYSKHIRHHNENRPAECEYCQKKFDKAKNLSEHIRLQHRKDEKMKKCDICDKEFINAALLRNHVKTHDKCFKCPDCDRVFSSRYNLETHYVTHSGARNHECSVCKKKYSTKTSLKNHMATHSEERLFQCEMCAKTFKTNRRLYVHKFSHATEEKYQCGICLQKFKVKQYLKYHMNKHSTVKPFECNVCKKRFKHKKSFEKHMALGRHRKMTDVEHDCDFCDESFASKDLLVDHFAEVHHEENIINNIEDCEGMDVEGDDFIEDDDDEAAKMSADVVIKKEKMENGSGSKTKVVPSEA